MHNTDDAIARAISRAKTAAVAAFEKELDEQLGLNANVLHAAFRPVPVRPTPTSPAYSPTSPAYSPTSPIRHRTAAGGSPSWRYSPSPTPTSPTYNFTSPASPGSRTFGPAGACCPAGGSPSPAIHFFQPERRRLSTFLSTTDYRIIMNQGDRKTFLSLSLFYL